MAAIGKSRSTIRSAVGAVVAVLRGIVGFVSWANLAFRAALRRYNYALPLWIVLPASMVLHLLVGVIMTALPEGGGDTGLPIYQVRIVQAPAKPRATQAATSDEALGKLEVDSPDFKPPDTLNPPELQETPPEMAETQDTGEPLPAPELDQPTPAEPPPVEAAPVETAAITAPELPDKPPPTAAVTAPQPVGDQPAIPPPPPGPPTPTALPPALPPTPSTEVVPQPIPEDAVAMRTPPAERPSTPLDRLRERLADRPPPVDDPGETPPPATPAAPPLPPALQPSGTGEERFESNPLAALAMRRYRSHIQGRVKDNYGYPADFPCGIVTEIRLTISQQGRILEYELLRPSGNGRFDYAVELSVRRTMLDPPSKEIGEGAIRPKLRFKSKQCASDE